MDRSIKNRQSIQSSILNWLHIFIFDLIYQHYLHFIHLKLCKHYYKSSR